MNLWLPNAIYSNDHISSTYNFVLLLYSEQRTPVCVAVYCILSIVSPKSSVPLHAWEVYGWTGSKVACTRCSPEVMHKFLLWLYKSCCCNPADGERSGWPWAWREPPVSLQGPVHADSNVVSVSDYFDTDNYGVLTKRTAFHKMFLCKKVKLC